MIDDLQGKVLQCSTMERSHVTPMKPIRVVLFATLLLAIAIPMAADQITFSFIGNNSATNLNAGLANFTAGPSLNVLVTDATSGASIALPGVFTTSTGVANSYSVLTSPNLVIASYAAGRPESVLITDPTGTIDYVAGINLDRASFISAYPNGTGAFLNDFEVTAVDPAVLAMFGLGPKFDPRGSVSITSGTGNLVSTDNLTATVGGGTVTIQSASAVPEPFSMALLGGGIIVAGFTLRRGSKLC